MVMTPEPHDPPPPVTASHPTPCPPAEVAAIEAACRATVARTARLADLPDPVGFAAWFTADARLERPSGEQLAGRAAIEAAYAARPAQRLTRHLLGGTVVEVVAPDAARALSTVLLCSGDLTDPPGRHGRPMDGPMVVGEFDDELRREPDGQWRISYRRASFVLHRNA